jgi:hypothetical protein
MNGPVMLLPHFPLLYARKLLFLYLYLLTCYTLEVAGHIANKVIKGKLCKVSLIIIFNFVKVLFICPVSCSLSLHMESIKNAIITIYTPFVFNI